MLIHLESINMKARKTKVNISPLSSLDLHQLLKDFPRKENNCYHLPLIV